MSIMSDENKQKLVNAIKKMKANNVPEEKIRSAVEAFKSKHTSPRREGESRKEFGERVMAKEKEKAPSALEIERQESPYETAFFPRVKQAASEGKGYPEQVGGAIMDIASLIPRAGVATVEQVAENVGNLFGTTQGDESFLDQMGTLELSKDDRAPGGFGLAQSIGRSVAQDPLTYAPGIGQAKNIKDIGQLAKMTAYEGGLEAGSQILDPTKEIDYGSIMIGALAPFAGETLKAGGRQVARARFGEKGGELLDEKLVPTIGSPEGKIAKELDALKTERNIDIRSRDVEAGELMGKRIEAARKQGLDIAGDEYEDYIKPFRGFDEKAYETINTLTGTVDVLRSEAKPIKKQIAEYGKDLEAVYSKETLAKFVNQLKVDAKGGNTPKAKAAQVMINEIEPTLKQFDPVRPRAEKIQMLEGLQGSVQEQPSYNFISESIKSQPVMTGVYGVGSNIQRGYPSLGLSPEAAKALYGQIMAEQ